MSHLDAVAAHPAVSFLAQEAPRATGVRIFLGTMLMFVILCGGVFLLLQSSFGVKQGYLISGTAFFGSWLVLAVLWFTGVPGLPMPGPIPDIESSTPRFYGPVGAPQRWVPLASPEARAGEALPPEDEYIAATPDIRDPGITTQVADAQTAASEAIVEHYRRQTGPEAEIAVPTTVAITDTRFVRSGGRVKYVRLSTGPAQPTAATTPAAREVIAKITPATFDLVFETGSEDLPTKIAIGAFGALFLLHAVLLGLSEGQQDGVPGGDSGQGTATPTRT